MIQLPNGCYCSDISIHPKNWDTKGTSEKLIKKLMSKDWYLQYRFYDPSVQTGPFKNGKLRIVKGGINKYKTPEERRFAIEILKKTELRLLKFEGYNPITDKATPVEQSTVAEISSDTCFSDALDFALSKLQGVRGTKQDAKSVVKYFKEALSELHYDFKPIGTIRSKHICIILDYMQENNIAKVEKDGSKKPFTNEKYNRYRANLVMIFKQLKRLGAIESNYVEDVDRKKRTRRKRKILTKEERNRIREFLQENNPAFLRFVRIFHSSGGRETELMSLRGRNVDLINQLYTCIIKKGVEYVETDRPISKGALPYWVEQMKDCGPDDYVFSKGLKPGPVRIDSSQITRRWKRWVKDKLGIDADIYSLKHSHSTEVVNKAQEEIKKAQRVAAAQNAHTTGDMVAKVYDIRSQERIHETLKDATNDF